MFFDGDPKNPMTMVRKCAVLTCTELTAQTWCNRCQKAYNTLNLPREEFAKAYVPAMRVNTTSRLRRARCIVATGGCNREGHWMSMCQVHSRLWADFKVRNPEAIFEDWSGRQSAYDAYPECLVPACIRQSFGRDEVLCRVHSKDFKADVATGDAELGEAGVRDWSRRQAPAMGAGRFSLAPLSETARLEVLYALQERDRVTSYPLRTEIVRYVARYFSNVASIALLPTDVLSPDRSIWSPGTTAKPNGHRTGFIRDIASRLSHGLMDSQGIDPTDRNQWDLRELGLRSKNSISGKISRIRHADFSPIRQDWLRQAAMEWVKSTRPLANEVGLMLTACKIASRSLGYRSSGGADPAILSFADMTSVFETFNHLPKADGGIYSYTYRVNMWGYFCTVLDFGRACGLYETMPASFSRHPKFHKIFNGVADEDELGRAVPESVIDQLNANLHLIGAGYRYGSLAPQDVQLLFETVYIVLRDTGRRPYEVAGLMWECLEKDGEDWGLIWDNKKARRLRRRLPIFKETVDAILRWRARSQELGLPSGPGAFLFPPRGIRKQMTADELSGFMSVWRDAIPEILSDVPDLNGDLLPFDRSMIIPYGFRHAYCQRHADAGVPVEVLADLMDHKNMEVTRGYYKVSIKRKREAASLMRRHTLDRAGATQLGGTASDYERQSVAVPYGNCKEPTNVKAGGGGCRIRFQCAGCGFYEPDPSYLPAIEDEIRRLKADRGIAELIDAAKYVIDNFDGQIHDYEKVVMTMESELSLLPEEERLAVEQAAKLLRRARAGRMTASGAPHVDADGRTHLPLSVVSRGDAR
ncbi:tyrosine-type recombinase/integrase [Kitasatospora purpeofusca]|uniref:tyrosine-type recombinase/integrase n=1 Tax=Kitasatospora purpeofusca TaxID=67352 RepID=UPI00386AB49E|nr:site-specific integrase [Kitasatospora purpeofusca]